MSVALLAARDPADAEVLEPMTVLDSRLAPAEVAGFHSAVLEYRRAMVDAAAEADVFALGSGEDITVAIAV